MKSPFDVAKEIADAHKRADPDIEAVYVADAPDEVREIRMVEVSGSAGQTGQVLPFHFAARPDLGIPYESVIVLLSPEEWNVLGTELHLPPSWGEPKDLKRVG